MDDYMPVSSFDAIYLIDLCEPLLEVARRRFAAKGWRNVHCLHQDASKFVLPEWHDGEVPTKRQVTLVTMSYSLSMVCPSPEASLALESLSRREQIPTFHETLDRVQRVLDPEQGMIGVVDFYAGRESELSLKSGKVSAWMISPSCLELEGLTCSVHDQDASSLNLDTGLVNSWFWTTWFSFDHVHLHPSRRSE